MSKNKQTVQKYCSLSRSKQPSSKILSSNCAHGKSLNDGNIFWRAVNCSLAKLTASLTHFAVTLTVFWAFDGDKFAFQIAVSIRVKLKQQRISIGRKRPHFREGD